MLKRFPDYGKWILGTSIKYGNPVFCWPGFFEHDARSACRGATCHKPRSDFRVPRQAMVGVGFGV